MTATSSTEGGIQSASATGTWDHSVDLLIVGSGAGAMTAGCVGCDNGADVLLIEKGDQFGGSSAMSGGGLWVPCNHLAVEAGIEDDMDTAWKYLKGCVRDDVPEDRLRMYLDTAPKMVKYLTDKTQADFIPLEDYADYYPRIAGSKPGGRSLDPVNFNGKFLGDDFLKMRESAAQQLIMARISMTIPEARISLARTPGWMGTLGRLFMRYALDIPWRFKSKRDRNLSMGNALVGMLRRSLMDRDVPLWMETPARRLIVEGGRVVGLEAERAGKLIRIEARKGVILAAGGFDNTAFPWMSCRRIEIGHAAMMALRVNYVGELGWELHMPIEYLQGVYDTIMTAGAEFGIRDFGMYAMDSLRLEKGYRAWKVDLTQEYTPIDAGLERFVDFGKEFIGRAALERQQQTGAKERMVPLLVQSEGVDAPYCATVLKDGEAVGLVCSSGYGHTLKQSIALAFLRTDLAVEGQEVAVEVFGERVKAVVGAEPLYDPSNARLKA